MKLFLSYWYFEDLSYNNSKYMLWWKNDEDDNFERIVDDRYVYEVGEHVMKMNCKAHLCWAFGKRVSCVKTNIRVWVVLWRLNGVSDNDNNDNEADIVKFKDIDDERIISLDDGFGVDNKIHGRSIGPNNVEIHSLNHGKPYIMKTTANRSTSKNTTKNIEIVPVLDNYNSDIEMKYVYEELDSSDLDSNSNKENEPKYD